MADKKFAGGLTDSSCWESAEVFVVQATYSVAAFGISVGRMFAGMDLIDCLSLGPGEALRNMFSRLSSFAGLKNCLASCS